MRFWRITTGVTKRFWVFAHAVYVAIKKMPDRKYRLHVYDQHGDKTIKRFGVDGLETEEKVEAAWQKFLAERDSIFKHDRAGHSVK